MDPRQARALYFATALIAGVLLALPLRPTYLGWIVAIVLGVIATLIRNEGMHERGWSRIDLAWGLVFVATLLPVAYLARTGPFG